ncbi:hypothetical protein ACFUJR_38870 [Streptomyces sp. NPDC057271]|uniref:hypothetical protein n=1 Tax=unclassified Streptomyces TaxID=2593676 RepID=UPI00362EA7D8
MAEIDDLVHELSDVPRERPSSERELSELLGRIKTVAGLWADVLDDLLQSAEALAGPGARAALEIAFRRAEESYVELEIAHGADRRPSGDRAPRRS